MSDRLPNAARAWAEEASAAKPVTAWVTPKEARMIRVPQLPPPRYYAIATAEDGGEVTIDWACHVRCGRDLPRDLGLDLDYKTLLRLIKGDFIAAAQPTPRNFLLDLTSLHRFLHDVRDPLFWTPDRKRRYQEARAKGEYV